jgi:hypothetical protein
MADLFSTLPQREIRRSLQQLPSNRYESYQKSLTLDAKSDYALEINSLRITHAGKPVFKEGVDNYNIAQYGKALESFELVHKMVPDDSSAVLNAAFSAEHAGKMIRQGFITRS